jgi:hypothetical protein
MSDDHHDLHLDAIAIEWIFFLIAYNSPRHRRTTLAASESAYCIQSPHLRHSCSTKQLWCIYWLIVIGDRG